MSFTNGKSLSRANLAARAVLPQPYLPSKSKVKS
jgi:hypothetical protein